MVPSLDVPWYCLLLHVLMQSFWDKSKSNCSYLMFFKVCAVNGNKQVMIIMLIREAHDDRSFITIQDCFLKLSPHCILYIMSRTNFSEVALLYTFHFCNCVFYVVSLNFVSMNIYLTFCIVPLSLSSMLYT